MTAVGHHDEANGQIRMRVAHGHVELVRIVHRALPVIEAAAALAACEVLGI